MKTRARGLFIVTGPPDTGPFSTIYPQAGKISGSGCLKNNIDYFNNQNR
jgi:hypothetical protein